MAINLDDLMKLNGAIASGVFAEDGTLVAYKSGTGKDYGEILSMMGEANSLMKKIEAKIKTKSFAKRKAKDFVKHNDKDWSYHKGWAVSAGDYSICMMGNAGIFVETDKADFRKIFKKLSKEGGIL